MSKKVERKENNKEPWYKKDAFVLTSLGVVSVVAICGFGMLMDKFDGKNTQEEKLSGMVESTDEKGLNNTLKEDVESSLIKVEDYKVADVDRDIVRCTLKYTDVNSGYESATVEYSNDMSVRYRYGHVYEVTGRRKSVEQFIGNDNIYSHLVDMASKEATAERVEDTDNEFENIVYKYINENGKIEAGDFFTNPVSTEEQYVFVESMDDKYISIGFVGVDSNYTPEEADQKTVKEALEKVKKALKLVDCDITDGADASCSIETVWNEVLNFDCSDSVDFNDDEAVEPDMSDVSRGFYDNTPENAKMLAERFDNLVLDDEGYVDGRYKLPDGLEWSGFYSNKENHENSDYTIYYKEAVIHEKAQEDFYYEEMERRRETNKVNRTLSNGLYSYYISPNEMFIVHSVGDTELYKKLEQIVKDDDRYTLTKEDYGEGREGITLSGDIDKLVVETQK